MYIHMLMTKKERGIKGRAYVGSVIKIVILLVAFSTIMVGMGTASDLGQGFFQSCDADGTKPKNIFDVGETVYVVGFNLIPDSAVDVYVVKNRPMYNDGEPIGPYIVKKSTNSSEVEGVLALGVVGSGTDQIPYPGEYDIVYDKDQDGCWNDGIDLIDYEICIGFRTIPEFTTIAVPVVIALIIGLFIFRRKKR